MPQLREMEYNGLKSFMLDITLRSSARPRFNMQICVQSVQGVRSGWVRRVWVRHEFSLNAGKFVCLFLYVRGCCSELVECKHWRLAVTSRVSCSASIQSSFQSHQLCKIAFVMTDASWIRCISMCT